MLDSQKDKILRSHRIVRPKGRMMLTTKHLHFTAAMSSWIWLTFTAAMSSWIWLTFTVAVVLNVVDVHGRFILEIVDFCGCCCCSGDGEV